MKRKELVPGQRYVDDRGRVFEVVSNEAGYEVRGGEHVHEPRFKQRYMGPDKGYKDYQTNTKVPVLLVRSRRKEPMVVEPRDLVMTVAEWSDKEASREKQQAKLEAEKRGWEKAFKEATGLTGSLEFQHKGDGAIVVPLTHLKRKGIKPGVK